MVFEDAKWDECLETCVKSSFSNQGAICLCTSRIYVHRDVFAKFTQDFVKLTNLRYVPNDPRSTTTTLGALISQQHLEKVMSYVQLVKEEGGVILTGGHRVCVSPDLKVANGIDGYFMEPTVVSLDLTRDGHVIRDHKTSKLLQEEIFGPLVIITPFDEEEQVLEWVNGNKYGLCASVWTENGRRQRRISESIDVGTVWVNTWMLRDLEFVARTVIHFQHAIWRHQAFGLGHGRRRLLH